jgi:flagellar hook-length control protein FliK
MAEPPGVQAVQPAAVPAYQDNTAPAAVGAETATAEGVVNMASAAVGTPASDPPPNSEPSAPQPDKKKTPGVDGAAKPAATPTTNPTSNTSGTGSPPAVSAGQPSGPAGSQTGSPAGPQGTTPGAGQAERVRFVQRVVSAFEAMGNRTDSVRIRLSPPELGSLHLEISVQNGTLSAHLQAETPAARDLLLHNLPELRQRLSQQDIKVDRFDVDLMERSPGGTSGQGGSQPQWQQHAAPAAGSTGAAALAGGATSGSESPAPAAVLASGRLNVIV